MEASVHLTLTLREAINTFGKQLAIARMALRTWGGDFRSTWMQ